MSAEATEVERKSKGIAPVIIVAVLTLALGGGVGAFVVAPMVTGGGTAAPEDGGHGQAGDDDAGGHGDDSGHGGGAAATLHSIENLVVNPAGTQGTRFLIVSLALEPNNSQTLDRLTASDAAIRDTLLQVLASKTIQELSDPGLRDQVREEMRAAAEAVISPGKITKVFLPQFVLQ